MMNDGKKVLLLLLALLLLLVGGGASISVDAANGQEVDYSLPESIWYNGTHNEIYDLLRCDDIVYKENKIIIYDDNTWPTLYQTYYDALQKEMEEGDEEWSDDGFLVQTEIRLNQYGRGVYAKEFVPEGTLVYRCFNTRCIDKPDQVRLLLKNLPRHFACEVMNWAYLYNPKTPDEGMVDTPSYCLELDDNALLNHAYNASDVNLVEDTCFPPQSEHDDSDCEYRANRDIYPGEELLINYNDITTGDYSEMGLGGFAPYYIDLNK